LKAAVCYEFKKPLVIDDLEIEKPHRNEVMVRISSTAVCHSDIHFMNGDMGGNLPFVPGHESSGYIEEVGEGVNTVKKGDPVVLSLLRSCGQCRFCRTGRPNMCEATWPLDTESRLKNKRGQSIGHGVRVGSFAEYVVAHHSQVVKIPASMPMAQAALLACGVITGYGAVVNRAKVEPANSVVVIGVGGVGLNAIQGAAICGAYPIIAVDRLDNKLEASRKFGATHVVNTTKVKDPVQTIKEMTSGHGADYVFITVGNTAAVRQGLYMTGRKGMAVVVGLATDPMTSVPLEYIDDEKILTGSFMGTTNLQLDIPKMVTLYQAGRLKLDELITHRYPLDRINEAIDEVKKGEVLRNVILFS
jgi:S-(hydroxymethyl)glutathione dehydrogenase / alcohol dehydrogenase